MRAVIDTNVLVSGMLSRRMPPAKVLDGWVFRRFDPVVSPVLVREYGAVLPRDKFAGLGSTEKRIRRLEALLALSWVTIVYPQEAIQVLAADPKDNMVLECARAGVADYVVSADAHLLSLGRFEGISIVTPARFLEVW